MKKSIKLFISMLVIIIITVSLWIANAFFGNPISKMMAKNSAQTYINDNYSEHDVVIEDVFYNFKSGYYEANVKSKSSIDTHFTVSMQFNKVAYDSYEDRVLSGWNTYERLNVAYRELVEDVFAQPDFPLKSEIDFGEIPLYEARNNLGYDEAHYGITLTELELDKQYDIKKLAEKVGHIVYYAQDEDISFERASELLRLLKAQLDEADVPFYAVSFVLEQPRTDDEPPYEDKESIHTAHFLASEINSSNLAERIERAHNELMEYYAEQDAKMKN